VSHAEGAARPAPLVTLDGPAGSGKTTTAREVARRLGFRHLDSGALYRALAYGLLEAGVPPERWPELAEADLRDIGVDIRPADTDYDVYLGARVLGTEIRSERVTAHSSRLAKLPAVRAHLLDLQRRAGRSGALVADGRDMGTVVFPDAEVKVYLLADLMERARRRLLETRTEPTDEEVREEARLLDARDRADKERAISPLRKPEEAFVLDTTALTFEEQVEAVVACVRRLTSP